jgi:hypothetical protein
MAQHKLLILKTLNYENKKIYFREKQTPTKSAKVFKTLSNQHLESVIGGPETSRGTETTVQDSN